MRFYAGPVSEQRPPPTLYRALSAIGQALPTTLMTKVYRFWICIFSKSSLHANFSDDQPFVIQEPAFLINIYAR